MASGWRDLPAVTVGGMICCERMAGAPSRSLITRIGRKINPVRTLISAMAGLAGSLAYFDFPLAGIGWVWPFLLLLCCSGRLGEAFRSGWTAGTAFFGASLYWLWNNPYPQGAIPGWMILSLYAGLYPAVWTWLCAFAWREVAGLTGPRSGHSYLLGFSRWPGYPRRLLWAIFCSCAWVSLEWLRSVMITGFPWNLLGISQSSMPVVSQLAQWGGVPLVSLTVCLSSLVLGLAGLQVIRSAGAPGAGIREAAPVLVIAGFLIVLQTATRSQPAERTLRIAAIQPGFTQSEIWNASGELRDRMWQKLLDLTRQALESDPAPELVLWPEGAAPVLGQPELDLVSRMAADSSTPFAICLETRDVDPDNPEEFRYFNSAMFIDAEGNWTDENGNWYCLYSKQHLVPFGEFIPLESVFPWLARLIPIGSFSRGDGPGTFYWKDKDVHLAFCICFEDSVSGLIRRSTTEQTQIILNMTNDAWFGKGSAQVLHARHALFRSIELGIPMVRATNNGLTCWTSPEGVIHGRKFEKFPQNSVHDAGFKIFNVPVRSPDTTFYRKHGNLVNPICLVVSLVLLVSILFSRRMLVARG